MLVSDAQFQTYGRYEGGADLCDGHQEPGGSPAGYRPHSEAVRGQNPRIQAEELVSSYNSDFACQFT